VIEVVVAGAGPNGLMLACELGLAGIRPMVLDPMPGPNPNPRVNRIVGQGVRILITEVCTARSPGRQSRQSPLRGQCSRALVWISHRWR
jgi:2-polyprenyl-6-methoxyphenol hydroxylase-like FAD-dependent oxidoreductase